MISNIVNIIIFWTIIYFSLHSFISYNAPNLKTQIETFTSVDLSDPNNNPFDNKVIIIDEAHNFISRIVNKVNKQRLMLKSYLLGKLIYYFV